MNNAHLDALNVAVQRLSDKFNHIVQACMLLNIDNEQKGTVYIDIIEEHYPTSAAVIAEAKQYLAFLSEDSSPK